MVVYFLAETNFLFGIFIGSIALCLAQHVFLYASVKENRFLFYALFLAFAGFFASAYIVHALYFLSDEVASLSSLYRWLFIGSLLLLLFAFYGLRKAYLPGFYFALALFLLLPSNLAYTLFDMGQLSQSQLTQLHSLFALTGSLSLWCFCAYIAKMISQAWRKNADYRAATVAKNEFLTNMSHEIRTPLNAIVGMGELLEAARLNTEEKNYLKILKNASDNLMALINDILDLSKIEAGKIELEKVIFCPKSLIRSTTQLLRTEAAKKGIALRVVLDEPLPYCEGDPTRMRQILMNLCSNAVKFTHEGYVEVTTSLCSQDKLPKLCSTEISDFPGFYLLMKIKDTGIGIPVQKWDAIFESFAQADSSTTRRFGGSGLGLAITRHLVNLMGGRIWVESLENQGSTFFCLLPLRYAAYDSLEASAGLEHKERENASIHSNKKLAILLVEDNPDNQVLFQAYFKNMAHEIQVVANGMEALEQVQRKDFDLVFMDIQMPVLDGLSATRQIRKWENGQIQSGKKNKATPIYALTAHAMKQEIDKSNAAGCDGHITKPLRKQELLHVIERHAA